MLISKVLALRKLDAQLPLGVRRDLVDSLYGPYRSLVVGAVSCSVICVGVSYRAEDVWLTAASVVLTLVGGARIATAWSYRYRANRDSAETIWYWERAYAAGAAVFAFLLGVVTYLAFTRSEDLATHLVTASMATGYAAGITGRNAGRAPIALSQVVLAIVPISAALLLSGDGLRMTLGLVMLLFVYSLTDITMSARDTFVRALVSTRENAALAAKYAKQAALFDSALNNMSHGLCMFDREGRLLVWNERFLELSNLPNSVVVPGARARDLLRRSVAAGAGHERYDADFSSALEADLQGGAFKRMMANTADGRTISLTRRLMHDGGSVVIFEDITEQKQAEAHIARLAAYDDLTSLPNRVSLRERLRKSLDSLRPVKGEFALHLIDLDYFKQVNDTLGHPIGDSLLQQVSARLEVIAGEHNFVARFGGDEFVIVQHQLQNRCDAGTLAQQVTDAMRLSFDVEGHRIQIGASVGIAFAPKDGTDPDELLKRADMALYAAKAGGRGTYDFFEAAMDEAAQARRALDLDLREAIARGELEVLFQPLVDLRTGTISTCEALLRWHHPVKGLISPAEFIPIAEETGQIVHLGEWVLQQACLEAVRWPSSVRVAVNLSPVQFKDPSLTMRVTTALSRSGLPASRLELEITETIMLQDSEATLTIMSDLQRIGVRMSLDDFGTGYSSLSYLRKFPFQKIKIDGSFVRDLENDDGCVAIIRAIASMGSDLGMSIVVEGVETEAQRVLVQKEGCTEVQGYLFGRPMSAPAIRKRFSKRPKKAA